MLLCLFAVRSSTRCF